MYRISVGYMEVSRGRRWMEHAVTEIDAYEWYWSAISRCWLYAVISVPWGREGKWGHCLVFVGGI